MSERQRFSSLNTYIPNSPTKLTTNEYSDIHIIYTGMKKHQIKSGYYYIFWGLATVSVVLGQIYVGSGYRLMTESIEEVTKEISKAFD